MRLQISILRDAYKADHLGELTVLMNNILVFLNVKRVDKAVTKLTLSNLSFMATAEIFFSSVVFRQSHHLVQAGPEVTSLQFQPTKSTD